MVDEPHDAPSELARAFEELFGDHDRFDEVLAMVADDFVQQDRRKLVGGPDLDKEGFRRALMFFLRETSLDSRYVERLALRGDRLVLDRITERHRDGSVREFFVIGDFGGAPVQLQRTVMFDTDDVGAAMAELDRLQAEIEVDDS